VQIWWEEVTFYKGKLCQNFLESISGHLGSRSSVELQWDLREEQISRQHDGW